MSEQNEMPERIVVDAYVPKAGSGRWHTDSEYFGAPVNYLRNDYGDDGVVISRAELPGEMAYALILAVSRVRIVELEAIVAKLPHTADGVPVVPGSMVWHPDYLWRSWEVEYDGEYGEYTVAINPDRKGNEWEVDFVTECYSTHAAAEKASQS